MSETGVVKFQCEHVRVQLAQFEEFEELNRCRRKLLQLRMIGVDANGIGFGNMSVRAGDPCALYITGSGTGGVPQLTLAHFAKVTAYDFARNWLRCEGEAVASSESLTHAAVYEAAPEAAAVIHCHSARLWEQLLDRVPTTSADVEYGTPEMALEVQRIFRETDLHAQRIFVMGGHAAGIVAFGANMDAACTTLLERLN